MKISSKNILGWSGVEIAQGDIVLGLVPDMGGRIMSLSLRGEELLYVPPEGRGVLPDLPKGGLEDVLAYKRAQGLKVLGGDKTWIAPEWEWLEKSPPLDLDAGRYALELRDDAVVMTSSVCRETGLQVVRKVGFSADGDIFLSETLKNMSERPVTKGVWNVTQIARPFDVHLPAPLGAIRSYHLSDTTLPDPELVPSEKDGWVHIPCHSNVCYKFGGLLNEGRLAVFKKTAKGLVVFARVFSIATGSPYAHRSMVEVFNSDRAPYGEVEVHSPLSVLQPGASVELLQLWRIYSA